MYQKFKYILIGTIILVIVIAVITIDAGTRYSSKNKNVENQSKTLSPEQIQALQQANQAFLPDNAEQTAQPKDINSQQDNKEEPQAKEQTAQTTDELINKQYEEMLAKQKTIDEQQSQNTAIIQNEEENGGYFTDITGKKLNNYELITTLNAGDSEFAIIEDTERNTSYTRQILYIYNKIDDKYYKSYKITERTVTNASNLKPIDISVSVENNQIVLNYNVSKTNMVRRVSVDFLKTNYQSYMTSPQLKYIEEEEPQNN